VLEYGPTIAGLVLNIRNLHEALIKTTPVTRGDVFDIVLGGYQVLIMSLSQANTVYGVMKYMSS
jgi:hypothetical protein